MRLTKKDSFHTFPSNFQIGRILRPRKCTKSETTSRNNGRDGPTKKKKVKKESANPGYAESKKFERAKMKEIVLTFQ